MWHRRCRPRPEEAVPAVVEEQQVLSWFGGLDEQVADVGHAPS